MERLTDAGRAAEVLREGKVVAFPTDTVYGLAAATEAAVRRIYELKGRDAGKPLVLRSAEGTTGVRVPDHPLALELLRASGPLWTTSANRSGRAEALTADEVAAELPEVDAVLDGGRAPGGTPSTVLDLSGPRPAVLREGAIPLSELAI